MLQKEDRRDRDTVAAAPSCSSSPFLPGHVVVEHGDVPRRCACAQLDELRPLLRLPHERSVRFLGEHLPQPLSHDRMIVRDDDFMACLVRSEWTRRRLRALARGAGDPNFATQRAARAPACRAGRATCLPVHVADRGCRRRCRRPRALRRSRDSRTDVDPAWRASGARRWSGSPGRCGTAAVGRIQVQLQGSGGKFTRQRMPVRFWNSFACQPTAATRPMSSSISGRRPVAILRTVGTAESIS